MFIHKKKIKKHVAMLRIMMKWPKTLHHQYTNFEGFSQYHSNININPLNIAQFKKYHDKYIKINNKLK
jgi:hypothetical protein